MTLWSFALFYYQRPKVSEACLALQDGYGVDVNMLIYAAWNGIARGVALTPGDIADADARIAEWRHTVVRPLRVLRRLLKTKPMFEDGTAVVALRDRIKATELEAESLQLAELERFAPAGRGDAPPLSSRKAMARDNIEAMIGFYCRSELDSGARALRDDLCRDFGAFPPDGA